jgi:hypothetical protein
MAKGGVRKGAGRPVGSKDPNTLIREKALLRMRELVCAEIDPLTNALIKKGKEGDVSAIRELFDRAWGKAPQALTDAEGKNLQLTFDAIFNVIASSSEEHNR